MQLLAANNAQTVLASGINASATTLTLATGGGSLFPTPVTGTSLFKLTLLDAATETQNEIVHVTAVSGDVFTIVRAQEGTTARSWSANDIAMCAVTAGTLTYFAQLDSPVFTGTPQGPTQAVGDNSTALATTAFTQAAIQAWGVGVSGSATPTYVVKPVSGTSTSPTQIINTLTTDVQATVQAPVSGERFGGWSIARDLRPAQMGVSGSGATASYWYRGFSTTSAAQGDWKQLADINSPTFTGTPMAPTAAPGTNTTQLATTAFVHQDGVGIAGLSSNLKGSLSISSNNLGFTADSIIVAESLSGNHYRINSYVQICNLSTTGPGGMDIGSAPASGWVAIYAIYNPTTKVSSILATNSTNIVAPNVYGGSAMPSGYTASGLISVWRTTSGSVFQFGYQRGRRISTPRVDVLITNSNPGGYTAIPLAQAVPQNAVSCRGYAFCNSGSGPGAATLVLAEDTNGAGFLQAYAGTTGAIGSDIYFEMLIPVVQNIFYQFSWTTSGVSNATVGVSGYEI